MLQFHFVHVNDLTVPDYTYISYINAITENNKLLNTDFWWHLGSSYIWNHYIWLIVFVIVLPVVDRVYVSIPFKIQSLWTQTSWRLINFGSSYDDSSFEADKTKLSIKPWKWRFIIKLNIELHSFSLFFLLSFFTLIFLKILKILKNF